MRIRSPLEPWETPSAASRMAYSQVVANGAPLFPVTVMNLADVNAPERAVFGSSLFIAPALFALSSFFWEGDGQYGVNGSTLLVLGSIFWIVAFAGVFRVLRQRTPRYAAWGMLFAAYGCICGGAAFAFQGLFTVLYGVPPESALSALAAHPIVANMIFWIGGPAFPVSVLILGIVLWRTGQIPAPLAVMLALGGLLFPVARIPRIDLIAHAVDLLMLIPAWYMGSQMLRSAPAVRDANAFG